MNAPVYSVGPLCESVEEWIVHAKTRGIENTLALFMPRDREHLTKTSLNILREIVLPSSADLMR